MQTYKVEYEAIGDFRWRFFTADDYEDAAWKANHIKGISIFLIM
mgnify:CR=1 FL=1